MRFSLIDRVTEHEPGVRLQAAKLVTSAEEYLGDHFPSFPVLPGVMMLEALAQAGRRLAAEAPEEPATGPLVVEEVRNVRYAAFVQPGQALEVEVTLKKRDGDKWSMQGVGTVEGKTAVQARFTLAPLPPGVVSEPHEQSETGDQHE